METISADTHPKAEKVLISLLRQKSKARKFSQVRSLSQLTIQLSKRAIARANKNLGEKEIDLIFIKYHYGNDLAEQVKKYLDQKDHENI